MSEIFLGSEKNIFFNFSQAKKIEIPTLIQTPLEK